MGGEVTFHLATAATLDAGGKTAITSAVDARHAQARRERLPVNSESAAATTAEVLA